MFTPALAQFDALLPFNIEGGLTPVALLPSISAWPKLMNQTPQEHIEGGLLTPGALQALVFTPAVADFDALLQLSRDALALAPCALLSHKAQRAAAEQRGFSSASFAPIDVSKESSKRSRAMLRALPQGESAVVLSVCRCAGPSLTADSGSGLLQFIYVDNHLSDKGSILEHERSRRPERRNCGDNVCLAGPVWAQDPCARL